MGDFNYGVPISYDDVCLVSIFIVVGFVVGLIIYYLRKKMNNKKGQ